MTYENALYFIAGGITTFLIMLWIAGHTELIDTFKRKLHSIWEPLQRNFGEKEATPYVDTHAPHVRVKAKRNASSPTNIYDYEPDANS